MEEKFANLRIQYWYKYWRAPHINEFALRDRMCTEQLKLKTMKITELKNYENLFQGLSLIMNISTHNNYSSQYIIIPVYVISCIYLLDSEVGCRVTSLELIPIQPKRFTTATFIPNLSGQSLNGREVIKELVVTFTFGAGT